MALDSDAYVPRVGRYDQIAAAEALNDEAPPDNFKALEEIKCCFWPATEHEHQQLPCASVIGLSTTQLGLLASSLEIFCTKMPIYVGMMTKSSTANQVSSSC